MDFGFVVSNAIVLACIYGTLAIGVSITWSSLGLVNLAYGFIFAFAGYGAWLAGQYISESGLVVLAAGILTGALGGMIVCLIAFIPIHDKPNFTMRGMIATLAISLIGTQALLWCSGRAEEPAGGLRLWQVEFGGSSSPPTRRCRRSSIVLLALVVWWMRQPARARDPRHDDEPPCRLDRRHRRPAHRLLRHGDDRRHGRACRGAAVADLLHRALQRHDAADQGRQHRAARRARQRQRRDSRGDRARLNEALTAAPRRAVRADHPVRPDHRVIVSARAASPASRSRAGG